MSTLVNIAKKEFYDLISSRMVLVILAGYFIVLLLNVYSYYDALPKMDLSLGISNSYGLVFADNLFTVLASSYGPIVGIMIGCASIASERHNNALNTLLAKPVFRDTIINGKLIGSIAFLMTIIMFSIIMYSSLLLVLCGDVLASSLIEYLLKLPIIFVFSTVLVTVYLSVAILISLLIRSQAFALIIGSLFVFFTNFMTMFSFADVISEYFPGKQEVVKNFIISITPGGFLWPIRQSLFNSAYDNSTSISLILPDLAKFSLYVIIVCLLSYVVFIRRDVA